jgi:hypothetical protein
MIPNSVCPVNLGKDNPAKKTPAKTTPATKKKTNGEKKQEVYVLKKTGILMWAQKLGTIVHNQQRTGCPVKEYTIRP